MAKKLTRTVFIDDEAYGPDSVIPSEIAKRITNPRVWADVTESTQPTGVAESAPADAPTGAASADLPVPDAEATVKELREYAKAIGVTLGSAKAKPEILAVLGLDAAEAAGDSAAPESAESDDDGDTEGGAEPDDGADGDGPANDES